MNAEMVSSDNKLDMDVANVQTASGRELPIEFHGEMKIRSLQQVQNQEKVTVRDEVGAATSTIDKSSGYAHTLRSDYHHHYHWRCAPC